MAKVCSICNKGAQTGRQYKRRGMAKAKGGAGIKITGKSARKFFPNLQRVKILLNGTVKKVFVCTKCIKAGKIVKV